MMSSGRIVSPPFTKPTQRIHRPIESTGPKIIARNPFSLAELDILLTQTPRNCHAPSARPLFDIVWQKELTLAKLHLQGSRMELLDGGRSPAFDLS